MSSHLETCIGIVLTHSMQLSQELSYLQRTSSNGNLPPPPLPPLFLLVSQISIIIIIKNQIVFFLFLFFAYIISNFGHFPVSLAVIFFFVVVSLLTGVYINAREVPRCYKAPSCWAFSVFDDGSRHRRQLQQGNINLACYFVFVNTRRIHLCICSILLLQAIVEWTRWRRSISKLVWVSYTTKALLDLRNRIHYYLGRVSGVFTNNQPSMATFLLPNTIDPHAPKIQAGLCTHAITKLNCRKVILGRSKFLDTLENAAIQFTHLVQRPRGYNWS